jgi:hypothetical protein
MQPNKLAASFAPLIGTSGHQFLPRATLETRAHWGPGIFLFPRLTAAFALSNCFLSVYSLLGGRKKYWTTGPHDFTVRDRPCQRSCRASCRAASSGKDGWQRRSSARRPIAHGKTRPAIPLRARRCRVHRIPPRVRDDSRSAPFSGGTGRVCRGDLPDALSGIFLSTGLDRFLVICQPGYFPPSFVRQKSLCDLAMLHLQFSRSFFLRQPDQPHRSDDVR